MDSFKHLSIADAKQLLETSSPVLVDIRDPQSFNAGRIAGAIHLDNNGIGDFIQDQEYDVPIIVCCYHGNMSQQAAQFLIEQGFDEVFSLDGGFTEWAQVYPAIVETG